MKKIIVHLVLSLLVIQQLSGVLLANNKILNNLLIEETFNFNEFSVKEELEVTNKELTEESEQSGFELFSEIKGFSLLEDDMVWEWIITEEETKCLNIGGGDILMTLDWGDGNINTYGGYSCHTYDIAGTYEVRIINPQSITYLYLDNSQVINFWGGNAESLVSLDLSRNPLSNLSEGAFDNLQNLEWLYLVGNQLTSLPSGIFDNLTKLTNLDLSSNRISIIERGIFNNLVFVGDEMGNWGGNLSLAGNGISDIEPGSFRGMSVGSIDLTRNNLGILQPGTFNGLTFIGDYNHLNLWEAGVTEIAPGAFRGISFEGQYSDLFITSNPLTEITKESLEGLESLTNLILSNLPLSYLPEDLFYELENLQSLNIAQLPITNLPEGIFTELKRLENLSLGGNQMVLQLLRGGEDLSYIPSNIPDISINVPITSLSENIFDGLENLQHLSISNFQLRNFPESIFAELGNLQYLYINDLPIISLPENIFAKLINLQGLSIHNLQLRSLSENIFARLTNLQELNLGGWLRQNMLAQANQEPLQLLKAADDAAGLAIDCNRIRDADMAKEMMEESSEKLSSGFRIDRACDEQRISLPITTLPENIFAGLINLQHLGLDNLLLHYLPEGIFSRLGNLEQLSLSNNCLDITQMSENLITTIDIHAVEWTNWKEDQYLCPIITYTPSTSTSSSVEAMVNFLGDQVRLEEFLDANEEPLLETGYIFTENGEYLFDYGLANNIRNLRYLTITAKVDWIDTSDFTIEIEYIPNVIHSGNITVIATLSGTTGGGEPEGWEKINGTQYTKTFTGVTEEDIIYTGEVVLANYVGTTRSATYSLRIDREIPTCGINYSTTGATNGNVIATLVDCNKSITGGTSHTFTENGNYTFIFTDHVGNVGSTEAEVDWILSIPPGEGNSKNSGNGGGGGMSKDYCPNGDFSPSYYDGDCGTKGENMENDGHNSAEQNESDNTENIHIPLLTEDDIYTWAKTEGLTTMENLEEFRWNDNITRAEIAKMISMYVKNTLNKNEDTTKIACTQFKDMQEVNLELQGYIVNVCQLGLMGYYSDGATYKSSFSPNEVITKAEIVTIISRMLRGDKHKGSEEYWYHSHLLAVYKAGIIDDQDDALIKETRGKVITMFSRI